MGKMSILGGLLIIPSGFLCVLYMLLALIKILDKVWWTPRRIQKLLALQGIKGPSYRLIYGNTKEISNMKREVMKRPKTLSHDTLPQVQPHIHSWTKRYGKNYLQWHGSQAQLIITEADLYKEIMNNKDGIYRKTDLPNVRRLLGDGLATVADPEKWTKTRKLATHAFHGEGLKVMIPAMVASCETMLARWKNYEGKEIEVSEEFRLLTSDVISRTAFGSSYVEGKKIFDMLMKLAFLVFKNTFSVKVPGMSKFFKSREQIESERLAKGMRDSMAELVKKREEKAKTGGEDSFGSDFLGLLIKASHSTDPNERISFDDLIDECRTFHVTGHETTSSLLSWTAFLLALHTDWQEEARKEVIKLFGNQAPNEDGIAKLKTMTMIIYESLRLYAPALDVPRKAKNEVRLGKLIVPANVELVIPLIAIHHEPEIWGEDAQLFKPERFSEGFAKATNNNLAAFIPFGMGPRTCVGMNFATTEAKIILSMILQRYSFTLSPAYVHSPYHFLSTRPQHGIQVMLHSL